MGLFPLVNFLLTSHNCLNFSLSLRLSRCWKISHHVLVRLLDDSEHVNGWISGEFSTDSICATEGRGVIVLFGLHDEREVVKGKHSSI